MNKKPTIKDIAKYAQVSTATVSNVVNGKTNKISEKTRKRVLEVIKEYNYIPNRMAGSLITKKTKTLGLIISDIANPFFPEVARGAEDRANKDGYNIIVCNMDNNLEKEKEYIYMLNEKMIDGVIMTSLGDEEHINEFYDNISLPIVLVNRHLKNENVKGKLIIDNFKSSYEGVSYIIKKGYKKIVMLSGCGLEITSARRILGYEQAIKDNNINFNMVLKGEYSIEWGKNAIRELIDSKTDFDAIFCGNDLIAIGAMSELKNERIDVPRDVAILGFDNIPLGEVTSPKLTTIEQPIYDIGYKAVHMLIDSIENKTPYQEINLDAKLLVRGSV